MGLEMALKLSGFFTGPKRNGRLDFPRTILCGVRALSCIVGGQTFFEVVRETGIMSFGFVFAYEDIDIMEISHSTVSVRLRLVGLRLWLRPHEWFRRDSLPLTSSPWQWLEIGGRGTSESVSVRLRPHEWLRRDNLPSRFRFPELPMGGNGLPRRSSEKATKAFSERRLVEAVGVEPTSEVIPKAASTGLVSALVLADG